MNNEEQTIAETDSALRCTAGSPEPCASETDVLSLAVAMGEVLLGNGAEIFRVEGTMERIAKAFGLKSFHFYVLLTGIFASAAENGETHSTEVRHVPLGSVHLGRVVEMNKLSRDIVAGKYTIEEAFARLEEIKQIPYTKNWGQILASGLGSGCFCYILGGDWFDSSISFLTGAILYIMILFMGRHRLSKILQNLLGSGLVTLLGLVFFSLGLGNNMDKIIIGSIIPLVPGVPITMSIRDFLNGDYLSGVIRMIDTILVAFCIAAGVGAVLTLWNQLVGVIG